MRSLFFVALMVTPIFSGPFAAESPNSPRDGRSILLDKVPDYKIESPRNGEHIIIYRTDQPLGWHKGYDDKGIPDDAEYDALFNERFAIKLDNFGTDKSILELSGIAECTREQPIPTPNGGYVGNEKGPSPFACFCFKDVD